MFFFFYQKRFLINLYFSEGNLFREKIKGSVLLNLLKKIGIKREIFVQRRKLGKGYMSLIIQKL